MCGISLHGKQSGGKITCFEEPVVHGDTGFFVLQKNPNRAVVLYGVHKKVMTGQ